MTPAVRLRAVDDVVLAEMVGAARGDAAPDEVTPPLTPGNTWTPERVEWLARFHADRRAGPDGPAGEGARAGGVGGDGVRGGPLQGHNEAVYL